MTKPCLFQGSVDAHLSTTHYGTKFGADLCLVFDAVETHLGPRGEDGTQPGAEGGAFGDVGWWEEGQGWEGEEEMIAWCCFYIMCIIFCCGRWVRSDGLWCILFAI